MIDHNGFDVSDLEESKAFYEKALKPLGYEVLMEFTREETGTTSVVGFGANQKADFWIGEGVPPKNSVHIDLGAKSRQQVDEFCKAAIEAGGEENGKPGLRPHYHVHYYGAFVLDPDGYNIEAVCHEPVE